METGKDTRKGMETVLNFLLDMQKARHVKPEHFEPWALGILVQLVGDHLEGKSDIKDHINFHSKIETSGA